MLVPEVILYHTLNSVIALLKSDYEQYVDKSQTILWGLLKTDDMGMELQMNRFNYYDVGVALFVTNQAPNIARKLEVSVGYNHLRAGMPTIHIMLPSETKQENGLGNGEGYMDTVQFPEDETITPNTQFKRNFTNVTESNYNLVITSDNSSETVLLYHVLKNTLFAAFEAFEFRGLRDVKFGGQDLQFSNEFMPPDVFHRGISLAFFYESSVNALVREKLVVSIAVDNTPVEDEEITSELDV